MMGGTIFIKKVIDGNVDELTHRKFVRFGKGSYEREPFKVKVGGKIVVKAGYEFVDDLLNFMADHVSEAIEIDGAVISRKGDLRPILSEFGIEPSVRGKKYTVKASMGPADFKRLIEALSEHYIVLGMKAGDYKVKMKKSPPKPGSVVEDFVSVGFPKGDLDDFRKEFLWDVEGEFKQIIIKHVYDIDEVEIPKGCEDDFEKARSMGVRKGKLRRIIDVDGKISENTYGLSA